MKIFFQITTILFSLVALLPFVNIFFMDMDVNIFSSDTENVASYLNRVCPIYLTVAILGMLLMAYMGDKYENKI